MADHSVQIQRMSQRVVGPQAFGDSLGFVLACVVRHRVVTERRRVFTLAPDLNFRAPERQRSPIRDVLRVDVQMPSGNQSGERHG